MFGKYVWVCAFGIGVLTCGASVAQSSVFGNPTPLSGTGGFAAEELRSIYRGGIGTGYSINSLNQQTLNRNTARIPNVGQSSAPGSRLDTGLSSFGNLNKPFSNFSPAPTVSPYLNLFRDELDQESDLNYQTLVRPQLRQQELNDRLQRENFDIARRLQSIAAQSDFNPQGSTSQPPTGHQTVFMFYGHYYPALGQRRR